jgi:hypothetical protein
VKLPNADRALVDIGKLRDYCLSSSHPRGKHKARVFAEALGLGEADAEVLQAALQQAAITEEATATDADEYGQRFVLDFDMTTKAGTARIRSAWMIRTGESFPRLVTLYVL